MKGFNIDSIIDKIAKASRLVLQARCSMHVKGEGGKGNYVW